MAYCRKCGSQLREGSKFCAVCGTPITAPSEPNFNNTQNNFNINENVAVTHQIKICSACGKPIRDNTKFCQHCGAVIPQTKPQNTQNTQNTQNSIHNTFDSSTSNSASSYQQNQYSGPAANAVKPKKNTAVIVSLIIAAVVVLAAVVAAAVLLIPSINGNKSDNNNMFGANPFESSSDIQSSESSALSPSQPVTEPYTQPTEAETAIPETQPSKPYNSQKIEVVSSGSTATLTLYEWQNGQWTSLFSTNATVGTNGVGSNYGEGKKVTPKGTYDLGFCYGLSKPNTDLNYKQINSNSIFVDDSSSKYYNCLVTKNDYSGSGYENTYKQFAVNKNYNYNIFIEHNGDGETPNSAVSGKGSVITICGYNGTLKPTLGCIDISSSDMIVLLSYLDSNKNPVIEIS
ncbi:MULTISPECIES: zinc-ribbon domain-containing protein [unclassified Ruminococcus]|uniref:zinc-ribbon domain-containing protein n=1 Tax=unclassified Ruminococcus TaxID=2608920 RepID=UPI00210CCB9D|nr:MULTISPECIES: zinc-ribbon domain-containing protein [unclassified Ruminococcus]MCQ4022133.1 zinc-ribbon domain-containing protein [Ruminococcus sp. zg-924]MCQ4114453.1 zinc-ribbon domain-containing protein [Ruminococcus sp. zg-921]